MNNGILPVSWLKILITVDKGVFPDDLKHADVITVHKKEDKCNKSNYKSVRILTNISKIYEKLMYNQIYDNFDDIPPSQCDFRKRYCTQHCQYV